MCMIDDAERTDFCRTKTRTARKSHVCTECGRVISPKEQYTHSTYGLDGEMGTNKRCAHCEVAARWLNKHCGGFCFGGIRSEIIDHYAAEYFVDDLPLLKIGICRQWAAFQGDGLLPVPQLQEMGIAS